MSAPNRLCLPLLAFALAITVSASEPYLVKDINTALDSGSSSPLLAASTPNGAFFFAYTPSQGRELWITDGTNEGTHLVKDIAVGPRTGVAGTGVALPSGIFVFGADDGVHGGQLWRSDGTDAGTTVISSPGGVNLTAVGSFVYFTSAPVTQNTQDLWRTDGTPSGTRKIATPAMYSFTAFGSLGDRLLIFTGRTLNPAAESLFSYDAAAGQLTQIAPISGARLPGVEMNGVLYFFAADGLWRTDGTKNGTSLVKATETDLNAHFQMLARLGDRILFPASDPASGEELWITDGMSSRTSLLKDIGTGTDGGSPRSSSPRHLVSLGDRVVFTAATADTGRELWASDGTPDGTVLLNDINPGTRTTFDSGDSDDGNNIAVLDGVAYFAANDHVNGKELWRSDGTPSGTYLQADINPGGISSGGAWSEPRHFLAFRNKLLFSAQTSVGEELWETDGTHTALVKDVDRTTASSNPRSLTVSGHNVYFVADDATAKGEVWRSDGTESGTLPIYVPADGLASTDPEPLTSCDGVMYFRACIHDVGCQIWRTDGTVLGTVQMTAESIVNPPLRAACTSEGLFYTTNDGALHVKRGTPESTVKLYPSNVGGALRAFGRNVVFSATVNNSTTLWMTDGTVEGTRQISTEPLTDPMVAIGGLLFCRYTFSPNPNLWVTDGTSAGTRQLANFNVPPLTPNDYSYTVLGNELFLLVGTTLWKSDGTVSGSVPIATVSSSGQKLVAYNGRVYFAAFSPGSRTQLWSSDGTAEGTRELTVIGDGVFGPTSLCVANDRLYFAATTSPIDTELWVTDGTAGGTHRVVDLNPNASSSPHELVAADGTLFFAALTEQTGVELWAKPPDARRRHAVSH